MGVKMPELRNSNYLGSERTLPPICRIFTLNHAVAFSLCRFAATRGVQQRFSPKKFSRKDPSRTFGCKAGHDAPYAAAETELRSSTSLPDECNPHHRQSLTGLPTRQSLREDPGRLTESQSYRFSAPLCAIFRQTQTYRLWTDLTCHGKGLWNRKKKAAKVAPSPPSPPSPPPVVKSRVTSWFFVRGN